MERDKKIYTILKVLVVILIALFVVICVFIFSKKFANNSTSILGLVDTNTNNETKIDFGSLEDSNTNASNDGTALLDSLYATDPAGKKAENVMQDVSEGMLYNQLNDTSKKIYTKLKITIPSLDSGATSIDFGTSFTDILNKNNGNDELNQDFQYALDAFAADNVELFYIDLSNVYVSTVTTTMGKSKTYDVKLEKTPGASFFNQGFENKSVRQQAIAQVEKLKNQVLNALHGSTADKVRQVHNCLIDNLEYDESLSRINGHNIYGALIERRVVCEGYAKAFKYLLDAANIPCTFVTGTGTNSNGQTEAHAWNYVKIDDNWYAVDVTWDDPIIVGVGELTEDIKYRYFLKGSDTFFENHVEDTSRGFRYQTISSTQY